MGIKKVSSLVLSASLVEDANFYANGAFDVANSASIYANAAFNAANNAVDTWVRDAANSASSYANGAYGVANSSGTYANAAFNAANNATDSWVRDAANSASSYANGAFNAANNATDSWVRDAANSASSYANGAYGVANTVTDFALSLNEAIANANTDIVTISIYANAAFNAANNASSTGSDDWARDAANSASSYANGAYGVANTSRLHANASYQSQNITGQYANAAFSVANSKFASAGGTISGDMFVSGNITVSTTSVINANTTRIQNLGTPTQTNDAATKAYVDEVAEGLKTKPAVEIATTSNLAATYNNGTSGVGATLTSTTNGAFPQIDGTTLSSTTFGLNGVLVKNQSTPAQNGRYNLTQVGNGSTPWILTRCGLCDEADEIPGAYVFVKQGTLYAGTGWVQTVANSSTFTVGTDAITVTQFSDAGSYTAGSGLQLNGNEFSISTELDNEIQTIFNSANAASSYANAAFAAANSSGGGSGTDEFARTTANAAFDKANTSLTSSGGTITGLLKVKPVMDIITLDTTTALAGSTYNWDILTEGTTKFYSTAATAAFWRFNIRGDASTTLNSIMDVGNVLTISALINPGTNRYPTSVINIDGTQRTITWADGIEIATGSSSPALDLYSYTIIKTADNTYRILLSSSRYNTI